MTANPYRLATPDTAEDWRERALCAQVDPELHFPEKGGSSKAAKAICQQCPVQVECLEHALANNETFGVWGGLTARERHKLGRVQRSPELCRNGHDLAAVGIHPKDGCQQCRRERQQRYTRKATA